MVPDQLATLGGVQQCPFCGQQNMFAPTAHPVQMVSTPAPPRKRDTNTGPLLLLAGLVAVGVLAAKAPWAAILLGAAVIALGAANLHGKRRLSPLGWMIKQSRPHQAFGALDLLAGGALISLSVLLMISTAEREEADRQAAAAAEARREERAAELRAKNEALLATAPDMEAQVGKAITAAKTRLAENKLRDAEETLRTALEQAKPVAVLAEAPSSLVEQYNAGATLLAKVLETKAAVEKASLAIKSVEEGRAAEKSKNWLSAEKHYAEALASKKAVESFEDFLPESYAAALEAAADRQKAISNDVEKARAQQEAEQAAIQRRLASNWEYRSYEEDMGGEATIASIDSENTVSFDFPYQGVQHGRLTLRRNPKGSLDVMLSIEKGQFTCGVMSCRVEVRFDEKPAKKFRAVEPSDYSSDVLFLRNTGGFLKELKKAETVRIAAVFYQEGQRVFEFDVEGFDPKAL